MDRWARFVDWCQRPSKIKVRSFNPRNAVVLAITSIILASSITFAAWRYQVVGSAVQSLAITRDNYESLYPTLRITEDTTLTEDYSGHILIEADGVTLDGNGHTITGAGFWRWSSFQRCWDYSVGIVLDGKSDVTVKNCRVTNFATGFSVFASDGNILLNNIVYENVDCGFLLTFSSNNTLLYNTAYGNRDLVNNFDGGGFVVEMSFGNIFKGNVAYDNGRGFQVSEFEREIFEGKRGSTPEEYKGNIFEANTARDNTEAGFWIGGIDNTFSNTFFHNKLIDNTIQAATQTDMRGWDNANTWDEGYPSGGNYWSDYEGVDADGDGIGDTPYDIPTVTYKGDENDPTVAPIPILGEPDGNNVDRYPLMAPFGG
jgi:parallel beta-helix repeat protein